MYIPILFDKLQFVSIIKRNITPMIRYRAEKTRKGVRLIAIGHLFRSNRTTMHSRRTPHAKCINYICTRNHKNRLVEYSR